MAGISKKEKLKDYLQCITVKENKSLGEALFTGMLFVLSLIYGFILMIRLFFYDMGLFPVYRPKIKVISVGNITVGGTGKTPLVEMIGEFFIRKNKKLSIVSRGYKAKDCESGLAADEPMMLKKHLPEANVIISKDRKQAIVALDKNRDSDVVILDDAFQNCAIAKTLDIVCIDCLNPFGNGYVIPRGIMRLPFAYLKRADVFVLTHCSNRLDVSGIVDVLNRYNHKALLFRTSHVSEYFYELYADEHLGLDIVRDQRTAVVCGISQPDNFKKTLESLGADVCLKSYFPDHHNFTQEQVFNIIAECKAKNVGQMIITAKDEPRLKMVLSQDEYSGFDVKILVLKIKIRLEENEEGFTNCLSSVYTA